MKNWLLPLALGCFLLAGLDRASAQGKAKEVEDAVQTLKTAKDPKVREAAAEDLRRIGLIKTSLLVPAVPALVEAAKNDASPEVRVAAINAIGFVKSEAKVILPLLMGCLDDKLDRRVRVAAASQLQQYGGEGKAALPRLNEMRKNEEAKAEKDRDQELMQNVNQAIDGIQQAFARQAETNIQRLRSSKDPKRRLAAAQELILIAQQGVPRGQPVNQTLVESLLRDSDVEVFQTLTQWLKTGKPDLKEVIPALSQGLNEGQDRRVRLTAATVLGTLRASAKDAIPALTAIQEKEKAKAEKDRDKELLDQVERALARIGPK